jgi:hypothetical protein
MNFSAKHDDRGYVHIEIGLKIEECVIICVTLVVVAWYYKT